MDGNELRVGDLARLNSHYAFGRVILFDVPNNFTNNKATGNVLEGELAIVLGFDGSIERRLVQVMNWRGAIGWTVTAFLERA